MTAKKVFKIIKVFVGKENMIKLASNTFCTHFF